MSVGRRPDEQRQLIEELREAFRELARETGNTTRAVADSGRAMSDRSRKERDTGSFLENAAGRAGIRAGRAAAFGVADDLARFGGGVDVAQSLGANTLTALRNLPVLGGAFAKYTDPIEEAKDRITGIVAPIARAGGTITDEMIASLKGTILPQAQRAFQAGEKVRKSFTAEMSAAADQAGGDVGNAILNAIVSIGTTINDAIGGAIFGSEYIKSQR